MSSPEQQTPHPDDQNSWRVERRQYTPRVARAEKVHKIKDQDACLAEVYRDCPITVLTDGVSTLENSAGYATVLAPTAMEKVRRVIDDGKNGGDIKGQLEKIFGELAAEGKLYRQEVSQEAAATLMIAFLFTPEDRTQRPTWWIAGVGSDQAILIRANNKHEDASPKQTLPGGFTHVLPALREDYGVVIRSFEYVPGDVLFTSTDGGKMLLKQTRKLSDEERVLLPLVQSAQPLATSFSLENLKDKLGKWPVKPGELFYLGTNTFTDDFTVAGIY